MSSPRAPIDTPTPIPTLALVLRDEDAVPGEGGAVVFCEGGDIDIVRVDDVDVGRELVMIVRVLGTGNGVVVTPSVTILRPPTAHDERPPM